MNRTKSLKVVATIAIALTIGALMMACTAQTVSKSTSESTGSHSSGSEPSDSSTRASANAEGESGTDAPAEPNDNASRTMACIGDSITYGYGLESPDEQSWPALLQAKLGEKWQVVNLGVVASTLINEGRYPYRSTGNVEKAKELGADLFVIMLGTNDANDPNWDTESYRTQLRALVDELADSASTNGQRSDTDNPPSQPQFVLMAPPCTFFYLTDSSDERNRIIGEDVRNAVHSVAAEKGVRFVDLYALTEQHPEWFPDYLHPNAEGAAAIADYVYEQVFGIG